MRPAGAAALLHEGGHAADLSDNYCTTSDLTLAIAVTEHAMEFLPIQGRSPDVMIL